MPKLTISVVTYNSEQYVRDFCRSLREQTFTDWELIVIDNASSDRSVALIRELMPSAHLIQQKTNIGFARAHNLAITWSKSGYVLIVNPDIVFTAEMLNELVRYADAYPTVAAAGPKLIRWDHEAHAPLGIIDSAGLAMSGPYRAKDLSQGDPDHAVSTARVFGLSGACVMYRRSALEEVKMPRFGATGYEYFDEDFFAYKEDVDLAWRLNLAGYEQYLVSAAVAYHQRAISGLEATRRERKKRSAINRYSYRNHLLMVFKNHSWRMTLARLPRLLWFEVAKYWYLAFLDGSSIVGSWEALRLLGRFTKKRSLVQSRRRISARELASLIP